MFHHGKPFAGDPPSALVDAAIDAGVRIVAYSRPGYAGSSTALGRDVASAAADTAAVLDHLGVVDCVVVGWSVGGPHALACAAGLGRRVRGVATVGCVAPKDAEGLDWFAGMVEPNISEFRLALQGAEALGPALEGAGAAMMNADAASMTESMSSLLPDVDVAAMDAGMAEELMTSMKRGMAAGIEGVRDDDVAVVASWGFDVADLAIPLTVWQGGVDRFVPAAHGHWLADRVSGAKLRLVDDEGHMSLFSYAGEMVSGLLEAAR